MSLTEVWVALVDFPEYAVSNHGRVMNVNTETIKIPTPNQQGIYSVGLYKEGKQHRKSVSILVAEIFLGPPPKASFDTTINLDGDRSNNHVDNLAWRPLWFARKYHSQFRLPVPYGFRGRVRVIQTDEVFDDIRECAIRYGLLEKEIILAAHNQTPVFPTWFTFELDSQDSHIYTA